MGLIAAALNAAGGTLASQWKEYFYVDALPDNVLATKAEKKVKGRFGGSRHEDDNVISDGSVIAATSGIWNKKTFSGYLGENFGVAKLPSYTYARGESGETQKQLTAFAGYKLMGVGQYSKNKSAALEFAEYYTNKENQVRRFKDRGFVPTNKEAREENDVQSDACATAIANQLKYSKTQKNVPSTLWLPMQGLGNAMITAATTGSEFRLETELAAYVKAIEKTTD